LLTNLVASGPEADGRCGSQANTTNMPCPGCDSEDPRISDFGDIVAQ
jgi:hypothetical protein